MTQQIDESTDRQWAEGVSPMCKTTDHATPEAAAVEAVQIRTRRMGVSNRIAAWGCLGARNAIRAGESGHRAIEVGMERVMDMMEVSDD